ncbi:MAG: RNA methyltransferase [Pelolinea sp.]|nr:RNA methyltransferase [Pelolinea sp.]
MKTITSPSNPTIKFIRSLKQKKERESSGLYYVEGIRLIGEAVRTQQKIAHVIVCYELLDSSFGKELISQIVEEGIDTISVPESVFESISLKEGPQGIAAVLEETWADLGAIMNIKGLWVALESVQDPGNLGSILRSADAAGGKGIVLLDESTDPYHPTSVRASMGGIFSQKIIKTSLEGFSQWKKANNYPLVGTRCGEGLNYRRYNYPKDMILLMGSEQKGLSSQHLEICDELVTIPMKGTVDSLNLSNAASIVLFEILAQHSG